MRSFAAASVCAALLALSSGDARGAEPVVPDDLASLVIIALERHPEAAALDLDADAARARSAASGRPMDVRWMLGVQALGAMPDSADPTMAMVGVEQMFGLPAVYQASRELAALDVQWAEAERARVAADVRSALWESAARLRAQAAQAAALDEQLRAGEAALALGLARYRAGGTGAAAMPRGGGQEPERSPVPAPTVSSTRPAGGMSGMGGMGAATLAAPSVPGSMGGMPSASMPDMAGSPPGGMSASMGAEALAALLRLDAELARVQADRDALAARRAGDEARLALIVGVDAARAVVAEPARFLGAAGSASPQPERTLAATSIDMAEADVALARAEGLPTFMAATDVRIMPDGMVDGVDARLGVTFPLWGGSRARLDAATATAAATARRGELVDRGLADAIAAAKAEQAAAEARAKGLTQAAVPRAHAAWDATVAVWGAGVGTATDLIAAWQAEASVTREAAEAELALELARARLARLEGK